MNAISISNLAICYDEQPILTDISLTIEEREFFVIIGPNGSGKTSLLKAIAGLITPTAGRINILGREVGDYTRKRLARCLAMVPQQMPTDFPFSVAETVLMGRSPHLGFMASEQQEDYNIAKQAMEFTNITNLAGRRLDQLSGGERQRVIIARAICQRPRILLLDEPTASLDPAHQINIMDLLAELQANYDVTVVMVSHDLNLASLYGNRLLLINQGTALRIGTPQEVLEKKLLEEAYGCAMLVDEHPLAKVPRILPIPARLSGN